MINQSGTDADSLFAFEQSVSRMWIRNDEITMRTSCGINYVSKCSVTNFKFATEGQREIMGDSFNVIML